MDWNAPAVPNPLSVPRRWPDVITLADFLGDDTLMAAAGHRPKKSLTIIPLATPGNTFWRWRRIHR